MTGGTNSIEKERSVDVLYLSRNDNRSSHLVFKLDTKLVISINSFTMINTPTSVINKINKMGEDEKQPDGIEFMSDGVLLFKDLYQNSDDNDDDSMASDDSFKPDKEYEEEFQIELKFL